MPCRGADLGSRMRHTVHCPLLGVLSALLLLSACGSRGVAPVASPDPAANPANITLLIVGLTSDDAMRRAFEDATVSALDARGVQALASHGLMPRFELDAREQIVLAARDAGAEGIVAVRALGLSADGELVERSPGPVPNLDHVQVFYDGARQMLAGTPGPDREVLVTTAYRTRTQELIWGGLSWTFELDDGPAVIDAVSAMLADNISRALTQASAPR